MTKIPMTETLKLTGACVSFGHSEIGSLEIVWDLEFGDWDLI
jgi:hypothetical protein